MCINKYNVLTFVYMCHKETITIKKRVLLDNSYLEIFTFKKYVVKKKNCFSCTLDADQSQTNHIVMYSTCVGELVTPSLHADMCLVQRVYLCVCIYV